jgi:hypothetical protein
MANPHTSWITSLLSASLAVQIDGDLVGTARTINFSDEFSAVSDLANDRVSVSLASAMASSATISGSATSTNVTFGTAESDTSYLIHLSVASISGSAAVTTPYGSAYATTGFTINVPTAPGVGTGVTINWFMTR